MLQIKNKLSRLINLCRYLSINKIINGVRLIISYLFSYLGLNKISQRFPFFISVEISNFCNLHCPECPVGIKVISKTEKAFFNFTLYQRLINELKSNLFHIILYFQGEPFLNDELTEFVKFAHLAKIYTSTSTNGQFLSSKNSKKIVLSGLDKLIVSVDGTTQETYQSYRIGGNLQKALTGIEELVHWKKMLNSATPLIELQFLVLKTNEHQISEMKQLAKSLNVDRLKFKTAQLHNFENGNDLIPTKTKYSRYKKGSTGKFVIKNPLANRCRRLWSGAVINAKGDVLPCCFDKSSKFSFGNIQGKSFYDCWHNKKTSDFRERILQDRKQFDICRNCTTK
jgi:radical SAM protein with 4Fe4S-binding SPASM domain